jgi:hypothetical protein
MTDLTPGERTLLMTRLREGIQEAPGLADLAPGAESRARRVRRTRRVGVVVAAAAVVAAVVAVPPLLNGHPMRPTNPEPAPARCVARSELDHADFRKGIAAWVRFCPDLSVPDQAAAIAPRGVLTVGAADLVQSWQAETEHVENYPLCGLGQPPMFFVQVGFTDGTTSQIQLVCMGLIEPSPQGIPAFGSDLYDALVTAIGQQDDARYPSYNPPGPARECPRTLTDPARMNLDGASARELGTDGPLLDLTATEALVCRYERGRLVRSSRTVAPESLRLASGIDWQSPGRNIRRNLSHFPVYAHPFGSYLVTMRDKTDTWRTFTVTGRFGALRLYRGGGTVTEPGYAGAGLLHLLGVPGT